MLPTVIPEALINTFNYWQEGIKVGMYHNNQLFTQVKAYGPGSRLSVYDDACRLANEGIHVCITASEQRYCLWRNLKSLSLSSGALPASKETALVE